MMIGNDCGTHLDDEQGVGKTVCRLWSINFLLLAIQDLSGAPVMN